jgi:integrase
MSSITKDPIGRSPYFLACFTAYVGQARRQWKKSTATTERKLARRIADELEDAAQGKRKPEDIQAFLAGITDLRAQRAARTALDDILRKTTGTGLGSKTARGYITEWLERNKLEFADSTLEKYQKAADQFFASLGGKADADMGTLRPEDVAQFRNTEAKRVSKCTANLGLKIVRGFFKAAEEDGVIPRNVARLVRTLRDDQTDRKRRAFTLPELKRVLAKCNDEWRSLVLFGLYTGARLGDIAALTWQAVDLEHSCINYVSRKTGRTVSLPIAGPLATHLETLPAGDDPKAPLHPRAFAILAKQGRVGALSNQFAEILADAGLRPAPDHTAKEDGPGRGGKRVASDVSFHALRHTAVSLLKNAGVGEAVARDIVGHNSAAASRSYTHIEDAAKRRALATLPDVGVVADTRAQKKS